MPLTEPLAWLIIISSFIASFINAAFAVGGALLMLAVTTSILPISAVIPLHSVLMFGSLLGRVVGFREHIYWPIVLPFAVGCLIGVFVGARIYVNLPEWLIATILSALMLSVWLPAVNWRFNIPRPFFFVGIIHSFLSTVFSYGGLFHPLILRTSLNKLQLTATIAGSLLTMGILKAIGYSTFGFDYQPYLGIIAGAITISFLGTWLGKQITHHISERQFRLIFKSIMTVFGLKLMYQAWQLF